MQLKTTDWLAGLWGVTIISTGQFLSLVGSGMTSFALTIWAWELTGSATTLALVGFFAFAPSILLRPVVGPLVDRWDKKLTMLFSDLATGIGTILMLFLSLNNALAIWHVYAIALFAGAFQSFQVPAYYSAITVMVSKEQYTRASGILYLSDSSAYILAPILAAALYAVVGLKGIFIIDIISFLFAYSTLLMVKIPRAKQSLEGVKSRLNGYWGEMLYGFRFIWERKSLLGLQASFFVVNIFFGAWLVMTNALILSRTNSNEAILAVVSTTIGIGMVAGSFLVSLWGGFKERKVRAIFGGFIFVGLFGAIPLGLGQNIIIWCVSGFLITSMMPLNNASAQAIWQSKVPPDVQGKVFAVRSFIATITQPMSLVLCGLLADRVFEPAMQADGFLASIFGPIIGIGDGAGIGLLFVLIGIATVSVGIIGYSIPFIREVETRVPDFDADLLDLAA